MGSKVESVLSPAALATNKPRPLAKFHPTVWGDYFASFSSTNYEQLESYGKQVEELKENVKLMLLNSTNDFIENITFINSLCRLGVSYHFKEEIEKQLQCIFVDAHQNIASCDLYTSALLFRVLRQHGNKISCEIFNKFKGGNGKFKESMVSDVRGMLSLYEATHVRVHGEDILDEALIFTKTHMESFVHDHPTHPLATQLLHALEQPLHKGIPRLEARRYITFYQEDKSRNETLLKFAVLDFNRVQLLHRQELDLITRWHKELGIIEKLGYVRDRLVECYFWIQGVYFEPCYSRARIILTKTIQILSVIDDTYDSYGTLEELECFTNAIQRWDGDAVDQLPDYMKFIYKMVLDFYQQLEKEMAQEGRSYTVNYAIYQLKELVKNYMTEVRWMNEEYVPSFDEYIKNAFPSSALYQLAVSSLVGMTGIAEDDAFQWIDSKPKCVQALEVISRFLNDIKGHKAEHERRHVASAVECYMNEYGTSEEKAVEEIMKMVEDAWKDTNEEWVKPSDVSNSMDVLLRVFNFSRTMDVVYKFDDGYTNSTTTLKDYITLLFIDPIGYKG